MARLDTPLCSLLDVTHPVVQAPIGSASTPELAAAVADAGGLGMLAMSWREESEIRDAIADTRSLTGGTFGVNVVLDESTGVLAPDECLDVCLDAGVDVVSLSFGDPAGYVERIHDAGGTALVSVGTAAEAKTAVDAGADAVVAQGWEAGGHVQGEVGTMALVPQVSNAVDVPVIAAGGLSDGHGLAGALALGADGVWLGTRFVATHESGAHPRYRQAIADADETDTVYTDLFDGGWPDQPHRVVENDTVSDWRAAGEPAVGERPGEGDRLGTTPDGEAVERYDDLPPIEGVDGDVEAMPHYAGQSAGGTDAVEPAGAVVRSLVDDAVAALDETSALVTRS